MVSPAFRPPRASCAKRAGSETLSSWRPLPRWHCCQDCLRQCNAWRRLTTVRDVLLLNLHTAAQHQILQSARLFLGDHSLLSQCGDSFELIEDYCGIELP